MVTVGALIWLLPRMSSHVNFKITFLWKFSHKLCNVLGLLQHEFSDGVKDYFTLEIFSCNEYTDDVSPRYDHSYDGLEQSHSLSIGIVYL